MEKGLPPAWPPSTPCPSTPISPLSLMPGVPGSSGHPAHPLLSFPGSREAPCPPSAIEFQFSVSAEQYPGSKKDLSPTCPSSAMRETPGKPGYQSILSRAQAWHVLSIFKISGVSRQLASLPASLELPQNWFINILSSTNSKSQTLYASLPLILDSVSLPTQILSPQPEPPVQSPGPLGPGSPALLHWGPGSPANRRSAALVLVMTRRSDEEL